MRGDRSRRHRHAIWFLDGNVIIGHSKLKDTLRRAFRRGRSFDEPGLAVDPPGTEFRAAGIRFASVAAILFPPPVPFPRKHRITR